MLATLVTHAYAQWPNKPVKIVVPIPAGSSTDIGARILAERFSEKFGQPFIIENKPGANGKIAMDVVAKAPADGYTLLFTYAAAHVVTPLLYEGVADPILDFAPVAQMGSGGNVLLVSSSMPVTNLREFIEYTKSKPVSYGSWGVGSGAHLSMLFVEQHTNVVMLHVPFKSTVEVNNNLLAGHINAAFSGVHAAIPMIHAGKVRAIAMSGPSRHTLMPDVKTMTEQGVTMDISAWFGLFAPAGTPASIVNLLNTQVNQVLVDPTYVDRVRTLGHSEYQTLSPPQFARVVRKDFSVWKEVIQKGKVRVE